MTQTLQAVYENGAFRPLEPVACREQERVLLTVQAMALDQGDRTDNEMLAALKKIEVIQQDMNPKAGKTTLDYLREAREGGMYGFSPGDD
jgi:predicted DNA-binding antitoxin AbrB/MazE fold protein